jgi:hypothetical protein
LGFGRLFPAALWLLSVACASSAPRGATADKSATPDRRAKTVPQLSPLTSPERAIEPAPPRAGASGSTRNTVSCGEKRCKVGHEVCTNSGSTNADLWACLPESSTALGESVYACDDPSDCHAPSTCCLRWASNENFACGKPDVNCKSLPCSVAEGTACPKGQHCQDGFCGVDARATCGSPEPCPAEAPYCAWSGTPECVSKAAALAAEGDLTSGGRVTGLYQCTKPSDCGTQACCTSTGIGVSETFCMNSCDSGITMTVCDSTADCRQFAGERCGKDAACRKTLRCGPIAPDGSNSLPPPWMKLCSVAE